MGRKEQHHNIRKILLFLWVVAAPLCTLNGQTPLEDPTFVTPYSFINYDTNRLIQPGDRPLLGHFFNKLDSLLFYGTGQVHIVHLGGSHIQTDIYTHQVRKRLQQLQPGMHGGRGLIFPVRVTGSNNPTNFTVGYTGRWQHCRNTTRNATCNFGLAGMMVVTGDSLATITISNRDTSLPFGSDIIRVHHYDPTHNYRITMATDDPWLVHSIQQVHQGITEIRLNAPVDTFTLEFYKTDNSPAFIEVHGIESTTDHPGVIYSALGVNGASIPSFLRANLMGEQLHAIKADLVVISLGTNDGYSTRFDPGVFERNYEELIRTIQTAVPEADILLTVPNDVYLRRRRANPATIQQETVIYRLAQKHHCGVWNFFQVMGGFNSVPRWHSHGLMQNDRIHFTREGYLLKGDLMFSALLKSYGDHLEQKPIITQHP